MDRPDLSGNHRGNLIAVVFPGGAASGILVLAAQYESLTLPLSIIMIVPWDCWPRLSGVWLTKGDNNVFHADRSDRIGGIVGQDAILIVEFARELEFAGRTPVRAASKPAGCGCARS